MVTQVIFRNTFQGGLYVFQIFDFYSSSGFVLLWVIFFESIAVGWIFGKHKLLDVVIYTIIEP